VWVQNQEGPSQESSGEEAREEEIAVFPEGGRKAA
jgi:hypothetical protein